MKRDFTKKDLHTGDIIENRAGERGVVILENDCIVYQAGGLDIFKEVFTDDLFVDGTDRSGDIMKVYRDDEDGCLGFIDRTFVPVPDAENLFLLYNQYQEEWHLQITAKNRDSGHPRDESPVFAIPEENIAVHSRCLIVRKDDSGRIVDLEKDDLEKAKKYMVRMEERCN